MNVWTSARIRLVIAAAAVGLPDGAGGCVGAVLRPQQGPVQGPRLPGAEDRALRHLLLPERARRRRHRGADGGALARAAGEGARARAARAPAARPLRVASGLRADQRHRRASSAKARAASPNRCAGASSCRSAGRSPTPTTSSATSSCTRSSSTSPRGPTRRRAKRARIACRCGSSRAWRSISRSARSIRTRRCGCATRRARTNSCRTIRELDNPKYFPYRWGQAFWAYVAGTWGDGVVRQMLSIGAAAGDPEVAIQRVLGVDTQGAVRRVARCDPRDLRAGAARRDAAERSRDAWSSGGGGIWRRPERRPGDQPRRQAGSRSCPSAACSRSICSSRTPTPGRVLHKLTSTATDPHYSSLQFIHSAGAWDAASERHRHRDGDRRRAGARDLRREERRQGARDPARATSTRSSTRPGRPTARRSRSPA